MYEFCFISATSMKPANLHGKPDFSQESADMSGNTAINKFCDKGSI